MSAVFVLEIADFLTHLKPTDMIRYKITTYDNTINSDIIRKYIPEDMRKPMSGFAVMQAERKAAKEMVRNVFESARLVQLAFVPMALTEVALEQIEKYYEYCRINDIDCLKKHNRELKNCIIEYRREMRDGLKQHHDKHQVYMALYRHEADGLVLRNYMQADIEMNKQNVGREYNEIATRIALFKAIFLEIEKYDTETDKILADALHVPMRHKTNRWLKLMLALCEDIVTTLGYKTRISPQIKFAVETLANKAKMVVNDVESGKYSYEPHRDYE